MKCAFPKVVLASPVFKICHNFCYCFAPLCWHCFCLKCKVALSLTFVLPRAFICGLNFAIEFVSCAFCPRHVFASIFVTNVAITFAFVGFSFSMLPWRLPLPLPVCHCFCLRGCRGSCHHIWATDRPLILKIWSSNWGGGRINGHDIWILAKQGRNWWTCWSCYVVHLRPLVPQWTFCKEKMTNVCLKESCSALACRTGS